jgi:hypothetical protein
MLVRESLGDLDLGERPLRLLEESLIVVHGSAA